MKLEFPWVNPNLPENRKKEEEKLAKDPKAQEEFNSELAVKKIIGKLDLDHVDREEAMGLSALLEHENKNINEEEALKLELAINDALNKKYSKIESEKNSVLKDLEELSQQILEIKKAINKKAIEAYIAHPEMGKKIFEESDENPLKFEVEELESMIEGLVMVKNVLFESLELLNKDKESIEKTFYPTNKEIRNN